PGQGGGVTSRRLVLTAFGRNRAGSLTLMEGGTAREFGTGDPHAQLDIHSPKAWPLLLRGSRGLAESYARGYWDSPDLAALIRLGARNARQMDDFRRRLRPL